MPEDSSWGLLDYNIVWWCGSMALQNNGISPYHYNVMLQKTTTWIFIAMKISCLTFASGDWGNLQKPLDS